MAETFARDEIFRKSMQDTAIKRQQKIHKERFEALLPGARSKPAVTEYKVVYGIMRPPYQHTKKLGLRFLAKSVCEPRLAASN